MSVGTRRVLLILITVFLFSSCGCGTYKNVSAMDDPTRPSFVFGGVARDLTSITINGFFLGIIAGIEAGLDVDDDQETGTTTRVSTSSDENDAENELAKNFFVALIDLPFSLVGDIVTLPTILDAPEHEERPRYEE